MWQAFIAALERLQAQLEDTEPATDLQAVARIELANLLARAVVLARALAGESE